jgi:AraC family transcriptional regulator of adaptative response / DNA-3-methyladenine glycosylase II
MVSRDAYRRTIAMGGATGVIEISKEGGKQLMLRAPTGFQSSLAELERRAVRIFDLAASPQAIAEHLCRDPILAPSVAAFPGLRVPGGWDGFETAVRAILGQRISVKAATSLAGRLASRWGEELPEPDERGLTHLFPAPERLAAADLSGLGLTTQKMRSIGSLARLVADGELRLDGTGQSADAVERLLGLPGIGPWTAQYIGMRALGMPDAFPAGDLILRRAASGDGTALSEAELATMSERWRPWRAYAAMLLWASYARRRESSGPETSTAPR